jgi:hypothetical protein
MPVRAPQSSEPLERDTDDSDNRSHARQERDCQALAERGWAANPRFSSICTVTAGPGQGVVLADHVRPVRYELDTYPRLAPPSPQLSTEAGQPHARKKM